MRTSIKAKLDRLVQLCEQGEIRPQPGKLGELFKTEDWEVSEEFVTLSKEVASYYKPLIERLVEARILTVNSVPDCGVYEVSSVLDEHKSYFNEGKVLLFIDEEQVNEQDGELKDNYQKRLGKFVQFDPSRSAFGT
jgi:hypothetical protein